MKKPTFNIDEIYQQSNLTKSQLLIWLGQQLNPQVPLYNMALAFTLKTEIRIDIFQQAFQIFVDSVDVFRTVFSETDGIPQQQVLEQYDYPLEIIKAANIPQGTAAIQQWLVDRSKLNFDLSRPLFDSVLLTVGNNETIWYLNQHHLITDAWSTSLVFQYVTEIYELLIDNRLHDQRLIAAYADFAHFERKRSESKFHQKASSYWREQIAERIPLTDFYGKTVASDSLATERISCDLGQQRTAELKKIAAEKDVRALTPDLSMFNIYVTILFALLYRISGNKNIAIGTPSHNRPSVAFKKTIGLFIEIFPLKVTIEEDESFESLLLKVKAASNQYFLYAQPGSSIPESNNSFNVLLNYIHATFPEFQGVPIESSWVHPGYGDLGQSLRLQVHDFDEAGTFLLHFDFSTEVFEGSKRQWTIDYFLSLIDCFIHARSTRIADVDLQTLKRREKFLLDYNQTEVDYSSTRTIIDEFTDLAASTPQAIAITARGKNITYAELNTRSNQLALKLKKLGVGKASLVGLSMPRSADLVIAIWGILKVGAAYVPIDVRYPEQRKHYIIEDTDIGLILTADDETNDFSELQRVQTINLNTIWNDNDTATETDFVADVQLGDLAYVIYTSGSTGTPKGVMISHANLQNYLFWARDRYIKGNHLDFPLFSSISFDLTVTSIFLPLISGGRVVIYDSHNNEGDLTVLSVFEEDVVDIIKLTPSHLLLIKNLDVKPKRIKKFILGGEDLKCELAEAITAKFGRGIEIYNEYGPTEATVGCMTYLFQSGIDHTKSVPIGIPIANSQIYLLDDDLKPVPCGLPGEICISGAGVARGYWGDDNLSKAKFVDNPFRPGQLMYRSGDLARLNANELIEYLGRKDGQVKIRGARIELAEVEHALALNNKIRECVVTTVSSDVEEEVLDTEFCNRCGIPLNHPDVTSSRDDVCNLCLEFEKYRDQAMAYFRPMHELYQITEKIKQQRTGDYDCITLLSGGKDSTYVLYKLVEMGLKVLVFSLDNGFISEGAKDNIHRVVKHLGVDLVFAQTPAMNSIFVDSLNRFSNVCNGCFKTIYTLSMNMAKEKGIKTIFTGLSRGQIFETRLADLFRYKIFDLDEVDKTIIDARKAYHRMDDTVSQSLDIEIFNDDRIFEEIQFIDFYRYCDDQLQDILEFLDKKAGWIRPADTGRSTNCLINELGIYIHKKERGFHNYALPYSWDVRLGHKQRDAAMEELDDRINDDNVKRMLGEIGYDENQKFRDRTENRLVAYYVSDKPLTPSEMRSRLMKQLPDFMIPSYFVHLAELPLNANGKVDYRALPAPDRSRSEVDTEFKPAGTAAEEILSKIWMQVLNIERVGIHDNFFDLGGDSILNIQIINQAMREGLNLTPMQLFENPTVASLARVVHIKPRLEAEQGRVSGDVELTPIQHWFFQQDQPDSDHWNQAMLLELKVDVKPEQLQKSWQAVTDQHDILRAQFSRQTSAWRQTIRESATSTAVEIFDFSELAADEQDASIKQASRELHKSLDISAGILTRIAFFKLGQLRNDKVLFIIHHLVVDGLSWLILLEDIETVYTQLERGTLPELPAKSTSYQQWAEQLKHYSESSEFEPGKNFWQKNANVVFQALPSRQPAGELNTEEFSQTLTFKLNLEQTRALLKDVPGVYNTQINDAFLSALARCLSAWTGSNRVSLTVEGHGREEIVDGVNLSRTVGAFTTFFPVSLEIQPSMDPGQALKFTKEKLRKIPHHGIEYGILSYLNNDVKINQLLESEPYPRILFNYLGQTDHLYSRSSLFNLDRELILSRGPDNKRFFDLEINVFIVKDQLNMMWTYGTNQHSQESIQSLANNYTMQLRDLINHCQNTKTSGFTPSDFPEADFDQDELDDIMNEFGGPPG